MNFPGQFDPKLSYDSPVSLEGERFSFDSKPGFVQSHEGSSTVIIPDAHLLFSGDYMRIGNDLIISGFEQKFVVGNYFKGENRPALSTKDGATLSGQIVDSLTGHVHYAQAAAPSGGQTIGNVLKLSGSASAIRNGVSIELHIGDAIQKGDVIQTGSNSSIGMTLVDGSAFGMSSNARMVLNEMVYDPNGSSNSSLMSLVQGTITFVAGQTAKNGNMRVETPVATMGIRGTAVLVEIAADDGPTKFSVLVEPDGHTGSYNLYDKTTGQLIGTVSQAGQVTFVSVGGIGQPPTAVEQLKTLADQQAAKTLIQDVFKLYFPNYNPDDSNPNSKRGQFGSPNDNLNPFAYNKPVQDLQPPKIIVIAGPYTDPVTGVTVRDRVFFNVQAKFSTLAVAADQSTVIPGQAPISIIETFKLGDKVVIDDPDISNAPFFDIPTPFVSGSAVIKTATSTVGVVSESFLKSLLTIDQSDGKVSFDRLQFNFLDDGQTVTFMIEVLSSSGPHSARVLIPVTVTGANDEPTIVVGDSIVAKGLVEDSVALNAPLETHGTITFKDLDLTDAHTATFSFTSSASTLPGFVANSTNIGTFTIDPSVTENVTDTNNTGTLGWQFTLPDNNPVLQSLAAGQTITQIYTITITDDNGVPATQNVTITLTGTNDAPVLTADTTAIHQAEEVLNTTNSAVEDVVSGSLTFADVDLSDTHQATAVLNADADSVVWSGGSYLGIPQATRDALDDAMTALVSENNTDTNNQGSVGWTFKLPDYLFDFLADGETLTLIYDVTVTDNNGVSSTRQVIVQVGAANDQPVISVVGTETSGSVQEDASPVLLTDSGTITFTDTDLTDTHTVEATYNDDAASTNGTMVSMALITALGTTAFTVPATALSAGVLTFNWDFALDNSLIQYLPQGETITLSYDIKVKDNSGGTNDTSPTQTVTVTITGTNDAPTVAAVTVALTDTPAADTFSNQTGTLVGTDADSGETAGLTYAALDGATYVNSAVAGQYGSLTVNSNGTYSYAANGLAIDALHAGSYTDTFTVQTTDINGATGTATVTVNITGANDAPTVAAVTVTLTDTPAADTFSNQTGTLVGTDADSGETAGLTYAALDGANYVNTAINGQYGSLTVNSNGTYSYAPNALAINALPAGSFADTFTVQTTDSHGATGTATFTVNVTGTNDAPTVLAVTVALTDTAAADTFPDQTGTLAGHDVDSGETAGLTYAALDGDGNPALTVGGFGHYGSLTVNADGTYSYVPDAQAINALPAGSFVDTFTVQTKDIHGATGTATFTVNITGVNDAPVLNGDGVSVAEIGNGTTIPDGTTKVFGVTLSDLDEVGSLTVSATAGDGTVSGLSNGTVASINSAFSAGFTYTPNNTVPNANDKVTLTVTDSQGLSDTLNFVFNQTGTGGATLVGTNGKDIIFSTDSNDTLTGLSGRDNFVFTASSGNDTITDFEVGIDHIVLNDYGDPLFGTTFNDWLATQVTDTANGALIDLDANNSITLTGVVKASLTVNDFIIHPGSGSV